MWVCFFNRGDTSVKPPIAPAHCAQHRHSRSRAARPGTVFRLQTPNSVPMNQQLPWVWVSFESEDIGICSWFRKGCVSVSGMVAASACASVAHGPRPAVRLLGVNAGEARSPVLPGWPSHDRRHVGSHHGSHHGEGLAQAPWEPSPRQNGEERNGFLRGSGGQRGSTYLRNKASVPLPSQQGPRSLLQESAPASRVVHVSLVHRGD